ncbi:unnamed protein product [Dovyalis caffra]|uniref:Uncharacterized protein n=1 Tax=Dovyalis caffra TaxID=77055 RepID=A0AAV1QVV1_9ROSI|nr:unnamed protein product [Dovyalis caffra]
MTFPKETINFLDGFDFSQDPREESMHDASTQGTERPKRNERVVDMGAVVSSLR